MIETVGEIFAPVLVVLIWSETVKVVPEGTAPKF